MQRSHLIAVATLAMAVVSMMGCGGGKPASNERVHIALVGAGPAEYPPAARRGAEQAAAELDVDVEFHVPKNGTAAEQQEIVAELLAKGLRAIAISPSDAASQGPFLDSVAERVQLVTQDCDAPQGNRRVCYVGADNYEAGRTAGQLAKEAMPEGGLVVVLAANVDSQVASEQRQGLRAELMDQSEKAQFPGRYQIIDARSDDADPKGCESIVKSTLARHGSQPEGLCLIDLSPCSLPVVLATVKAAPNATKVRLIGFGHDAVSLQGLKDGAVYGLIVPRPFEVGYQTVKIMSRIARGDRSGLPETGAKFIEPRVIMADNVDAFLDEKNKPTK